MTGRLVMPVKLPVASWPASRLPSIQMVRRWSRMDASQGEKTEKITINLGLVDLGQIDLLVQEGFYTNRTDFIRTAIRTQLATRGEALDQTTARRTLTLGQLSLRPPRSGRDPRHRADDPHPGAGVGEHRRRCLSPARPGHDRLSGGARRLPCPNRGEGRPSGPHRLARCDHSGLPRPPPAQSTHRPAGTQRGQPPGGIPPWTHARCPRWLRPPA